MDKNTLLSYQPDYYNNSKVIEQINNTNAIELNKLIARKTDVYNQIYVDTATNEGLNRYEKNLGLITKTGDELVYRRSRILSKLRGTGTFNQALIKNIAAAFVNGDVEVHMHSASYTFEFTIKFTATHGIIPNLDDFKEAIMILKPSHLGVKYEYVYMTFDEFETYNKTWDEWDNLNLTFDGFEIYRE